MANSYVSKIKLGGTTYFLKDTEARAAVEVLQSTVASSLIFKGIVTSAAEITGLTNYKLGWTYKANASFTINELGKIESGDMIICIKSNTTYSVSDWAIVQNNVDIMTGASNTQAGAKGLVPAPAAGTNTKFLRGDGTWTTPDNIAWGQFSELI